MKSFKIVNSFVFLFVINLSITFLYKNNSFATFINGVLQTENNNLYQRKQRNLAESENLTVTDAYKSSNNAAQVYMDKFCIVEIFAYRDMLAEISRAHMGSKYMTAFNENLYIQKYASRSNYQGINIVDKYSIFSRFMIYIQMLSSFDHIDRNLPHVMGKIMELHNLAKKLVNIYIQESNEKVKEEISTIAYVTKFISSNYIPCTPEHEISPYDVLRLAGDIIFEMKHEKLIS